MGITNYTGSSTQNTQLLKALQSAPSVTMANEEKVAEIIPSAETKSTAKSNAATEPVVNNNGQNKEKPLGVSDSAWAGTQETHTVSDEVNKAQADRDAASNKYTEHTQKDMISSGTLNAMNQSFKVPAAVKEADKWLSNQLEIIQSGKTSYSDQVKDALDKIMNREKFSYDVDTDPLFQQALASAMNSGKQAMQDTIGQASALTGGYGSTYATSAGNQAYNAFIEDAYDNIDEYYRLAMEAYQMEGDEMYRQFGMLSELDDKEYNRNITAYDATYQHRNQMYNEAYTQFRDNKSDAFAMAGIEMQQYAQEGNDLYNLYNISSNTYESMYEKDYQSWADRVNNAWKQVEVENTDAWANKNFDESVRQYEQNYAQTEKWKQTEFDYMVDRDAVKDSQWEKEFALNEKYTNAQIAKMNSSGSGGSGGSGSGSYKLSTTEQKALKEEYKNGGIDAALAYLNGIGKSPGDENSLGIVESILAQVDTEVEANTPKSGSVSKFRTTNGDNFTVTVGKTSYGVENHGKVTDSTTLKSLNKLNTTNGAAFLYDGEAYVKSSGSYYKIGAKAFGGKDYEALKKALQK